MIILFPTDPVVEGAVVTSTVGTAGAVLKKGLASAFAIVAVIPAIIVALGSTPTATKTVTAGVVE